MERQQCENPIEEISKLPAEFSRPRGLEPFFGEIPIIGRTDMAEQVIPKCVRSLIVLNETIGIDAVAGLFPDLPPVGGLVAMKVDRRWQR